MRVVGTIEDPRDLTRSVVLGAAALADAPDQWPEWLVRLPAGADGEHGREPDRARRGPGVSGPGSAHVRCRDPDTGGGRIRDVRHRRGHAGGAGPGRVGPGGVGRVRGRHPASTTRARLAGCRWHDPPTDGRIGARRGCPGGCRRGGRGHRAGTGRRVAHQPPARRPDRPRPGHWSSTRVASAARRTGGVGRRGHRVRGASLGSRAAADARGPVRSSTASHAGAAAAGSSASAFIVLALGCTLVAPMLGGASEVLPLLLLVVGAVTGRARVRCLQPMAAGAPRGRGPAVAPGATGRAPGHRSCTDPERPHRDRGPGEHRGDHRAGRHAVQPAGQGAERVEAGDGRRHAAHRCHDRGGGRQRRPGDGRHRLWTATRGAWPGLRLVLHAGAAAPAPGCRR